MLAGQFASTDAHKGEFASFIAEHIILFVRERPHLLNARVIAGDLEQFVQIQTMYGRLRVEIGALHAVINLREMMKYRVQRRHTRVAW